MNITDLLCPERIRFLPTVSSKQHALEVISEMLATATPSLTAMEILDRLYSRERLGSTGLGQGVAIPHGRAVGLAKPVAAILRLDQGVDFAALDCQPVDILSALLMPEAACEEHLNLLAQLAELYATPSMIAHIRQAKDIRSLLRLLRGHLNSDAA